MNDPAGRRSAKEVMRGTPHGYFLVVPQIDEGEVVDVRTLATVIARSWILLLVATLIGAGVAAGISLLMTPIYRAQVLIAPVSQGSSMGGGGMRSQLGGLAALAGIDLGSGGGRKEEYIATLASAGFARDFIVSEKLMPILFADRWDAQAKAWKPGKKAPTLESGVKLFMTKIVTVEEDRKTTLVSLAVEWRSAELASRWANRMVEMVNERLRADATRNADQSIEYLNKELAKTNVVELRQAIYQLIEDQVNNAMMANVQREYAFRVVDPAVPPEIRARPKRTVMTIVGGVIGMMLGLIVVFMRTRFGGKPANPAAAPR